MQNLPETSQNITTAAKEMNGGMVNFIPLPDSDHYINKLESRLSKMKGSSKDLTSRDMISVLQGAREDFMHHLISDSTDKNSGITDSEQYKEVTISYIERKLFPEKNGVTYEELQSLLECDVLAKVSVESSSETLSDSNVDR